MYINFINFISLGLILLMKPFGGFNILSFNFSEAARLKSGKSVPVVQKPKKEKVNERDSDNNGFLNGFVRVKVFGNISEFAYYFVYIGIGNPKVKQMLIVDTGSQLVNVACVGCSSCGKHLLPKYNYNESITSNPVECETEKCRVMEGKCDIEKSCVFTESFSEGSKIEGKYVGDLVSFDTTKDSNDLSSFFDYIGCVTSESKLIRTQISNGILGLSKSDKPSLIDDEYYESQSFIEKYLTDHFKPSKKIFSLCLSENGGIMTLGGHDKSLDLKIHSKTEVVWANMLKSEFYVVKIYNINLQDKSIKIKQRKFVLDTGTTVSTFDSEIYGELYGHFKSLCDEYVKLSKNKFSVPKCNVDEKTKKVCFSDITRLPSIELAFENGSKFEWAPDSYMIDRTKKRTSNDYNWWCLGLEESKTGENILGATFFKNNHVIFDLHKDQVGLSPGKCPENKN